MTLNIEKFLEKHYSKEEKIILACSTWADSMYLLYEILKTPYKNNLVACYFNHGTRQQCQQEEDFLVNLGKKEGFHVEVAECDFEKIKKLYPNKWFEELAREKRYQFFDAVCHLYSTPKVITAHHLDDRIETCLFNMLRGSKLTGLINMTESSGNILRPLLKIEKKYIYDYLDKNKLQYFEDESNASNDYTRNYLRNEILPGFNKVHPEHKKNLQNLLSYFEEIKTHLDDEVDFFLWNYKDNSSQDTHGALWKFFHLDHFNTLSPLLQKEIIRQIYYISHWKSTIWLSEWNIAEILKFLWGKNNKTLKEIWELHMFKDGNIIWY